MCVCVCVYLQLCVCVCVCNCVCLQLCVVTVHKVCPLWLSQNSLFLLWTEQLKKETDREKHRQPSECVSVNVCVFLCVCATIITCELYSQCSLSDGRNHRLGAQPSSSDFSFGKQHKAVMTPALVDRALRLTSDALWSVKCKRRTVSLSIISRSIQCKH